MNFVKLLVALASLIAVGLVPALSQEKDKKDTGSGIDEWVKANQPNENHKLLEKLAGNWDAEVTVVFDPTQKPEVNKMTVQREMVLGGRFLFESYDLKGGSMPHAGRGYIGYNNATKKFQMVHMESMNTALEVTDGSWDEKTRTFSFPTGMKEMMWNGMMTKYSMVTSFVIESDDKHTFSILTKYTEPEKMEVEEVKIVYTRRK